MSRTHPTRLREGHDEDRVFFFFFSLAGDYTGKPVMNEAVLRRSPMVKDRVKSDRHMRRWVDALMVTRRKDHTVQNTHHKMSWTP